MSTMVNVRLPDELIAYLDAMFENRSEGIRQCVNALREGDDEYDSTAGARKAAEPVNEFVRGPGASRAAVSAPPSPVPPEVGTEKVAELRELMDATCSHPKDKRRNLGYATRCDQCGKML